MKIEHISLVDFRNYREKKIEFSRGFNLIFGPNGTGKTNLLEAVHFCCLGHSHRTRDDQELTRTGCNGFSLRMSAEGIRGSKFNIGISRYSTGKREISINGLNKNRYSDLIGNVPLVLFSAEDMALIDGGPATSRRLLDIMICQISGNYLESLRKYRKILKQRNSALRFPKEYPVDYFEVLEEQMAVSGAGIIENRREYLKDFVKDTGENYRKISGNKEELLVRYRSSTLNNVEDRTCDEITADLLDALKQSRKREIHIGHSVVGPHRDNLLFLLEQASAGKFGSQGQKRTIALSLKLACAKSLERKFGVLPVLIMDDAFAELDGNRRQYLKKTIDVAGQIILACPRKEDAPFPVDNVTELNFANP